MSPLVNLYEDLEKYRGLDDVVRVNAMDLSKEEKQKLIELLDICPNIRIMDNMQLRIFYIFRIHKI